MAGIRQSLKNFILKGNTVLCGGPMSVNCIDALIESSVDFRVPLVITASRRQVEAGTIPGGGYVFDTEGFVRYVRKVCLEKKAGSVYVARDHGGPWQGNYEIDRKLPLAESISVAKISFEQDIACGFDLIHIDPSVPIQGEKLELDKILFRIFDLYQYCCDTAKKYRKDIEFEIGTEEQTEDTGSVENLEYVVKNINSFCRRRNIKTPFFFVGQTGSRVMEDTNVGMSGRLDSRNFSLWYKNIKQMAGICRRYNAFIKEHNADYLRMESLVLRPYSGIGGANVAPEFAVTETAGLLYFLEIFGFRRQKEEFIESAVASDKWRKWVKGDGSDISYEKKTLLCGHYVYNLPSVKDIKMRLQKKMEGYGLNLNECLKRFIKTKISRYIISFTRNNK